jgi:hypothetical protein
VTAPVESQHGARTVLTRSLRLLLRFGRSVVTRRDILVVYGTPGTGKTFAVLTLCRELANWVYVPVDANMTPHAFMHRLLECLTGRPTDRELRGHLLERHVIDELRARQPILVIDDANFLGRKLIAQFIYLHAFADFALVLAGHQLDRVLRRSPELETRVARSVAFRRLRRDELLRVLADFHPLFARTAPEVLREIDTRWARGNLRRWARLLEVVVTEHPEAVAAGLTRRVGQLAIGSIAGGPFGIPDQEAA